jgi:hypothetical protein
MPVNCPDEKLARSLEQLPSNVTATKSGGLKARMKPSAQLLLDPNLNLKMQFAFFLGSVEARFDFGHVAPLIVERMEQNLKDTVN